MKSEEFSDKELKNMAPTLFSIEKKGGFSVPEGYFDSLSNEIMDRVSGVPVLKEAGEVNPFSIPANYFEELPLEIMNRIEASKSRKLIPIKIVIKKLQPRYSLSLIAACIAVIVCVRFFEKPILLNVPIASSQNASISEWDVLGEVDETTLENAVSTESAAIAKPSKSKMSKSDKSMEDYILNNNIDVSDLAKEL